MFSKGLKRSLLVALAISLCVGLSVAFVSYGSNPAQQSAQPATLPSAPAISRAENSRVDPLLGDSNSTKEYKRAKEGGSISLLPKRHGFFGVSGLTSESIFAPGGQDKGPGMIVGWSVKNDESPALRDMKVKPVKPQEESEEQEANENPELPYTHLDQPDPVIQSNFGRLRDLL